MAQTQPRTPLVPFQLSPCIWLPFSFPHPQPSPILPAAAFSPLSLPTVICHPHSLFPALRRSLSRSPARCGRVQAAATLCRSPRAMLTQPQLILPAAEETHRTQAPTDVGRCKFSLNEGSACIQLVTVERQSSGQKQLRSKRVSKPASAQLTARPTWAWQQGSAHAAVHQAAAPPGTPGPARALRGCCGRPPAARPGLPHGRPAATSGGWQGSSCRLWPGTPACAKRNTEWARRREAKHAVIADGRGRQAGKLG